MSWKVGEQYSKLIIKRLIGGFLDKINSLRVHGDGSHVETHGCESLL